MIHSFAMPPSVRAALWMLLAGFSYVITAALARHLAGAYSVFEVVFLRCTISLLILSPMMMRIGLVNLKSPQFGLHCFRTILAYTGMVMWFYAVTVVPVADFFALLFTTPLFTIALAVLFLNEKAGAGALIATLVGFAGILVILRPGLIEVSVGALIALGAAATFAGVNTVIKILSRRDSATIIVVYVNLMIMPLALVPALFDWRTPTLVDMPAIVGIAVFGTLAQFSVARSIGGADARVVQPVNFLRLPIAAAVGYIFFGELSDIWTWIGAVIIFGSSYYIIQREARSGQTGGAS